MNHFDGTYLLFVQVLKNLRVDFARFVLIRYHCWALLIWKCMYHPTEQKKKEQIFKIEKLITYLKYFRYAEVKFVLNVAKMTIILNFLFSFVAYIIRYITNVERSVYLNVY